MGITRHNRNNNKNEFGSQRSAAGIAAISKSSSIFSRGDKLRVPVVRAEGEKASRSARRQHEAQGVGQEAVDLRAESCVRSIESPAKKKVYIHTSK